MSSLEMVTTSSAIIGQVLVYLRTKKGMRQHELATAVGISPSTWSRIENGDSGISIDQLRAAAKTLDVSPGLILDMVEEAERGIKIRGVDVKTTWSKKSEGTISKESVGALSCVTVGSVAPLLLFGPVLGTLIGAVLGACFLGAGKGNKDEQEKSD